MSGLPRILLIGLNMTIVIMGAYYMAYAPDISEASSLNECLRVSQTMIRWIAGISSAVAVVGIIGVSLKLKVLECFYLFALLCITAATILLCMFVWAIMPNAGPNQLYFETAEHGIWLPVYGKVMQKTVANQRDWSAAKACFRRIDTCDIMRNQTEEQKVVLIDVGCCIPPNRCGLEQASTGSWVIPEHGLNETDNECKMWAGVGEKCFECDSCKAGYLGFYHQRWQSNTSSLIQCIAFLIVTSTLAYYILMHDHYHRDNRILNGNKFLD